jgi:hypothetical protein
MDIVKFKITPKTIKIEVRNTNDYVLILIKLLNGERGSGRIIKLYNALGLL